MGKAILLGILGLFIGWIFYMFLYLVALPVQSSDNSASGCVAMVTGVIFFAVGYWKYTRKGNLVAQPDEKEEAPIEDALEIRRNRVTSSLCPKCGNKVSPTDQNCPSCKVNLTFAREHLDQL